VAPHTWPVPPFHFPPTSSSSSSSSWACVHPSFSFKNWRQFCVCVCVCVCVCLFFVLPTATPPPLLSLCALPRLPHYYILVGIIIFVSISSVFSSCSILLPVCSFLILSTGGSLKKLLYCCCCSSTKGDGQSSSPLRTQLRHGIYFSASASFTGCAMLKLQKQLSCVDDGSSW
jgi:hypothetical protein